MTDRATYQRGPLDANALPHDTSGYGLGIRAKSSTREYMPGTRAISWDGRVYRYAKSGASCYTGRGNVINTTILNNVNGIDYAVLAAAAAIGDKSVLMTAATVARTLDELAGGHIVLKPTETYTDGELMFRTITGNTVAAAAATCRIYFDEPLETAMTTSNYAFAMASPYSDIRYASSSGYRSFGGIAATYISGSGYYFWLQTWGKCWLAPQAAVGATQWYRKAYWRHDGSVDIHTSIGTNVTDQVAGWIMDNNTSDNGATCINLTVDC